MDSARYLKEIIMGFNIIDKDGNNIGWAASEFTNDSDLQFIDDTLTIAPDIEALRATKAQDIKQQATQLLADTDWQLQRATERDALGVALLESETPKAILSYREAVRRASNRAEIELSLLDNMTDINAYTWQVEPFDYPSNKSLTHLEFLRRFTSDERIAITQAGLSNAAIADYIKMLDVAKFINTTDSDVAAGVQSLEAACVIDVGRAAEILGD